MTAPAAIFPDNGQRQSLKGLQQAFSCRVSGCSVEGIDIKPGRIVVPLQVHRACEVVDILASRQSADVGSGLA